MASKMIGIEIGNDTLKMAVVKNGVVRQMAVERLPENLVRDGRVTTPAAMITFLKAMMKKHKIRKGDCALVLPPQIVVCQPVTLPQMTEAELKLNLPFEFRDYIGKDMAKYEFDYIVLSIKGGMMNLYAAAARKDLVEEYYNIFKKAGLILKVATPAEMAWLNAVMANKNLPKELAILDMGYHNIRLNIFAKGNFIMGKDIEMGGQMLDEIIAAFQQVDPYVARTRKEANQDHIQTHEVMYDPYAAIAMEITKILSFYNYSHNAGQNRLQDIYYCGGTAMIEQLRTTVVKATDMTLHHAQRLVKMHPKVEEDLALYCSLAAGAALQKLTKKEAR